jgi:hypothetical protein
MASKALKKVKATPSGPPPDRLKIKGDWKAAVKKSFQKKKPPTGWPKNQDNPPINGFSIRRKGNPWLKELATNSSLSVCMPQNR